MLLRLGLYTVFLLALLGCKNKEDNKITEQKDLKVYTRFNGNYKLFKDLPEKHLSAAQLNGISPMETRTDTSRCINKLVRLPMELDLYKIDKLTYSVPYLVPEASQLLTKICLNFRDSLISKKMPFYKPIITSVTRTKDDVAKLTRRNGNASDNSAHTYGTTFDISWKRFEKIGVVGKNDVSTDRLKFVLGQVLHDLREREKCYIVHERKQACFHITVR